MAAMLPLPLHAKHRFALHLKRDRRQARLEEGCKELLVPSVRREEKPRYLVACRLMVPMGGLEPPRCLHQRILSPSRLPIPSHRHILTYLPAYQPAPSTTLCIQSALGPDVLKHSKTFHRPPDKFLPGFHSEPPSHRYSTIPSRYFYKNYILPTWRLCRPNLAAFGSPILAASHGLTDILLVEHSFVYLSRALRENQLSEHSFFACVLQALGPSGEVRTPGLMNPNHALYQLGYTRI